MQTGEEKWIQDFVERETALARKRVQVAETVMMMKRIQSLASSDMMMNLTG
jgi:hypothetical protein